MKRTKKRKKQSVPKKQSINKKDQKAVICLDPKTLKRDERERAAKLKIVKEIAITEDLSKLHELNQFDEDKLKLGSGEWDDESVNYAKAEAFRIGSDTGIMNGRLEGFKITKNAKNAHDQSRTQSSSKTKKSQRVVKEKYVIEAYTRMVNDKAEKMRMESLSENKMAQLIKERVEADLKKVKTPDHHPVLKPKISRSESVTFTGLSTKTIIDILRRRDKEKLPFYPWEVKDASRM